MNLIHLVLTLIVVGIVLFLVDSADAIKPAMKSVIYAVVVVGVALYLLQEFGMISPIVHLR